MSANVLSLPAFFYQVSWTVAEKKIVINSVSILNGNVLMLNLQVKRQAEKCALKHLF